jgi:hypothetical protein
MASKASTWFRRRTGLSRPCALALTQAEVAAEAARRTASAHVLDGAHRIASKAFSASLSENSRMEAPLVAASFDYLRL